jgi:HK97 gp10 family phage protein
MALRVRIWGDGFKELDRALGDLPKATARNVLGRVLDTVAKPIADEAQQKAPRLTGALQISIGVGRRLTRRQQSLHRKQSRGDGKAFAERFVGAGGSPQAVTQEFGTFKEPPQSYMRPAFDKHRGQIIPQIGNELWKEISKAGRM